MRLRLIMSILAALGLALAASLAQAAENHKVTFLLVNDIYKMEGTKTRGGFARLAAVVKAERAKGGTVIYVHAGDTISPSLMSGFDQGAHIIDLLNMAPPDFFVPGNHEFDFGPKVFRQRMGEAKFPIYAANLRAADGAPLKKVRDRTIVEVGDVKIGIIGLTADDSPVKSKPGKLQFAPTVETGVKLARQMRKEGVDIVVAVAHANRSQDMQLFHSGAIDLLLTGDDHDLALFYDGRKALVESKEEGEFVTAVDLDINVSERRGRRRVRWWPNFRLMDTAGVDPDPEVAARVESYQSELSKELDVAVGKTGTELDSRKASLRTGETAMGNMIADALRAAVEADIAITNGGGIRGNKVYDAGSELTRKDILTELPFGNKTMLLKVTGQIVLDSLENGFSKVEDTAGRFPHVSGMTVVADLSKEPGSRVVSVMVGDQQLDAGATYTLATNDYMARGGDGYRPLRKAESILGALDAKLMANDVMVYIRKAGTVSPKVEGRITLK